MNTPLVVASVLLLLVAAGHSYLGERYILMRLFRRENLPRLFGGDDFTKRTLRLAWHITSVLAVAMVAVLLVMANGGASMRALAVIFAAGFAVSGLVSLIVSRGRHLSWLAFFVIAALTWFGAA